MGNRGGRVALGFVQGPDRKLYYTPHDNRDRWRTHLQVFDVETREGRDCGPIVVERNRQIAEIHALDVGPDGTLYGVAFVYALENEDPFIQGCRRRGQCEMRLVIIDPANDLHPGTEVDPLWEFRRTRIREQS